MKFSVLICVYEKDNKDYFMEAYESILCQSLCPDEIVLVVDGPVPDHLTNSIAILKQRTIDRGLEFKCIWLEKNMGHGIARQKGVLGCTNDIIAIADADDINHSHRFLRQVEFLENNLGISIVGSQIMEVDHRSKKTIGIKNVPCTAFEIEEYMKTRSPLNQMTVMFRRADVLSAGNYIDFYHNEDYFLWVRMYLLGFKFSNLSGVLVDARINDGFYNRRGGIDYFLSEVRLQRYMYRNGVISLPLYIANIIVRLMIQVIIPQKIRGIIFRYLFRGRCRE